MHCIARSYLRTCPPCHFITQASLTPIPLASRPQPVSYISLAATVATGAGLVYWYSQEKEQKMKKLATKSVVVGNAAIGGPFELVNQDGKPFSDKDLLGEFALLYFGFTFCPDVCPEELEKISAAADAIGEYRWNGWAGLGRPGGRRRGKG